MAAAGAFGTILCMNVLFTVFDSFSPKIPPQILKVMDLRISVLKMSFIPSIFPLDDPEN